MRKLIVSFVITLAAATAAFSEETSPTAAPLSDAQKAFDQLKSALVGPWHGSVMGIPIDFTIRAVSNDTTILQEGVTTKGPTPNHEITLFYVEGDRLLATHYCDANNRVNLEGKMSADKKSVEFSFIDVRGSTKGGYVKRLNISLTDADKHVEQFTFIRPDGKPVELSGEFLRTK